MQSLKSVSSESSVLLIDTQALVWLASGDRRLSPTFVAALVRADMAAQVSAVTAFEYTELLERGRFGEGLPLDRLLARFDLAVTGLPADLWHYIRRLPDIHRDPVDRMLIAHAISLATPVASADRMFIKYPVEVIW